MNPNNSNNPDRLEASIHRVLRGLPDRKAPAGLEARVLAEIATRASLPWWRRSFAHWPASVRAGFFVVSGLAAALVVSGVILAGRSSGAHEIAGGFSASYGWLIIARDVVAAGTAKVRMLLAGFPPMLLYSAAGVIALCYVGVAAAGAATYKALTLGRQAA
jgi:hypothetical protein